MKKLFYILFFLSLFLITACSSSYIVNSTSPTYESSIREFNESAEGEKAKIILSDSTVITATEVYLSADSLYWFDSETKLNTGVVITEISKVMFTDMWRGGLEGAGIGLLSGSGAGLLFGAATFGQNGPQGDPVGYCAYWSLIGGVGGALIGFPIGAISGHKNVYEFQNAEQQGNTDKARSQ